MTDTTDKVAFAAAELIAASDALASAAADVDALRAEVARQTGIAVDHCSRADAAEQMVAELRAAGEAVQMAYIDCARAPNTPLGMLDAALSRTEAVAGRWVSVEVFKRHREALLRDMDRVGADVVKARAERDAAIARAEKAEADNAVLQQVIQSDATQLRAAIAARDEAVARLRDRCIDSVANMKRADAAERARDEAVAESAQWREALTTIIRELDDEDGCMGIDCEPLSAKEVSAQDVATAITKRAYELQGWVRRYIMGEPMRGDATSEEEHARAQVMTLICDRDNAIRVRDEVGIQLAAAQAEIARMKPVVAAARALWLSWVEGSTTSQRVRQHRSLGEALTALDAVPGDALAPRASRFVAGCDVFTDEEHKARAVTTWAARGDGPLWFVEDTATDSMCLVGGESMARRIAALLNGDALAPVVRGAPFDEAGTVNPDKLTAALEASGIDTDNVKGVE